MSDSVVVVVCDVLCCGVEAGSGWVRRYMMLGRVWLRRAVSRLLSQRPSMVGFRVTSLALFGFLGICIEAAYLFLRIGEGFWKGYILRSKMLCEVLRVPGALFEKVDLE